MRVLKLKEGHPNLNLNTTDEGKKETADCGRYVNAFNVLLYTLMPIYSALIHTCSESVVESNLVWSAWVSLLHIVSHMVA